MKDVGKTFVVDQEEWYTYDKSPRPNVHVLARVDEATYSPDTRTKMGDHPVVWTNEHYKARNVYIFMGHHPELFQNPAFTTIFRNFGLGALLLSEGMREEGYRTAWGLYHVIYESKGY